MTMRITKRKDISVSQEKDITIKTNTTLRLESLVNYGNGHVGSYNRDRTIVKK